MGWAVERDAGGLPVRMIWSAGMQPRKKPPCYCVNTEYDSTVAQVVHVTDGRIFARCNNCGAVFEKETP
jgi:transcription elongation factor Elf1